MFPLVGSLCYIWLVRFKGETPVQVANEVITDYLESPLGWLKIDYEGFGRLLRVDYCGEPPASAGRSACGKSIAAIQLAEFFAGSRTVFDLDYGLEGSDFQLEVWRQIARIPYGKMMSYGDIARAMGKPTASRAVGAACGRNPVLIIVPCHRVVGTSGTLTGYAGGMPRKAWLLEFEAGTKPRGVLNL